MLIYFTYYTYPLQNTDKFGYFPRIHYNVFIMYTLTKK